MSKLESKREHAPVPGPFARFVRVLGPGLITGASDDDPSGIGTYSQAGAQLGFGIGWTMLMTYPLMAAIQEISARLGRTTGHGIAGNLCRHYPNWLLQAIVTLLFLANAINIGADLSAMADATKLLIGGRGFLYVVGYGTTCVVGIVFTNYDRYVMVLKWMNPPGRGFRSPDKVIHSAVGARFVFGHEETKRALDISISRQSGTSVL
jgi:Mn2+/Fe2+ NRAMP family transporter